MLEPYILEQCKIDMGILCLKISNLEHAIRKAEEIIAESQREHIYGGKGQRDDFNHRISLYSKIYIRLKIIIWNCFETLNQLNGIPSIIPNDPLP